MYNRYYIFMLFLNSNYATVTGLKALEINDFCNA